MSSTPDVDSPDPQRIPAPEEGETDAVADAVGPVDVVEPVVLPEQLPDPVLIAAHDLARAALAEVTPESTIGEPAGYVLEGDGVVSLRFSHRLLGYPGWWWTVSLARVEDSEPTVLEVELLPGDGALLAPEWVPWAVRLADYQAAQAAMADEIVDLDDDSDDDTDDDEADLDDESDDDEVDDDESDEDLDDDDVTPVLHSGDVDGVDIDELDDTELDDTELDDDAELDADADAFDDAEPDESVEPDESDTPARS